MLIILLKDELYKIIEKEGIHSSEALAISREIDKLIVTYHKKAYLDTKSKDKK